MTEPTEGTGAMAERAVALLAENGYALLEAQDIVRWLREDGLLAALPRPTAPRREDVEAGIERLIDAAFRDGSAGEVAQSGAVLDAKRALLALYDAALTGARGAEVRAVAWMFEHPTGIVAIYHTANEASAARKLYATMSENEWKETPLYTHPATRDAERQGEDTRLLDFFEAHKTKMGPAIRAACLDEYAPTIRATIAHCMEEREGDDDEDGNDGEDEFDSPSSPTPPSGASPNA